MHSFDLKIGEMSKIEGKASLEVKVEDDKIIDFKFGITEYKRFYTQAIRGKDVLAIPQLTSRICGTCSNAHLLCAIKAVEDALEITPSEQTKTLRKLLNFGLIIRDHALHLYVFALPDLYKIDSILELDENKPDQHQLLHDTFQVKSAGNNLGKVIGGRSVHAPWPTVGGFIKLPDVNLFPAIVKELEDARPAVLRLIEIFRNCNFSLERDIDFTALMDLDYTFLEGEIISGKELIVGVQEFGAYLDKVVIPYSHATGYNFMGKLHMVGALARLNIGKKNLNIRTREDIKDTLSLFPSRNIFHNNLAQAIEILHAIDSSIDILKKLSITEEKPVPVERKRSIGTGLIEAPRGSLYYKLEIDENGKVIRGDIVVPTGQNQIGIEKSLYEFFKNNLDKSEEYLINESEKIVRAYDPCMSCASHFLKVKWISK